MTESELAEEARGLLSRRLKVDPATVTPETSIEELGADSLDLIILAGEFEETFSIAISTKEIQQIRTFDDIVRQLSGKLGCA